MDDLRLLRKLRHDPNRGMKRLMDLYGGLVWAVVKARLPSDRFCQADIEGCVADAFSDFYCGLDQYDPACGSIRSYLCVIAKNNALDLLRRHYRQQSQLPLEELPEAACADDFTLEGNFEDKEQRQLLLRAVLALGQPDREILVRKYYLGQSSRQIAQSLNLSVSNVDTRTHRAVEKLRQQLGGSSV